MGPEFGRTGGTKDRSNETGRPYLRATYGLRNPAESQARLRSPAGIIQTRPLAKPKVCIEPQRRAPAQCRELRVHFASSRFSVLPYAVAIPHCLGTTPVLARVEVPAPVGQPHFNSPYRAAAPAREPSPAVPPALVAAQRAAPHSRPGRWLLSPHRLQPALCLVAGRGDATAPQPAP